jgi:hypothetical protein
MASSSAPGPDLTVEVMKMAAQEFDVEGINKLSYVKKGLVRITAVDQASNLIELNLSSNLVEKIECLHTLKRLKKLHLTVGAVQVESSCDP